MASNADSFDMCYSGYAHAASPHPRAALQLFKENRSRLIDKLIDTYPSSIVLLEGGKLINHYDTATSYEFRQESFFYWLFGVTEPDIAGTIDIKTGKSVLFVPKLILNEGNLDSNECHEGSLSLNENCIQAKEYGADEVHCHYCIDNILRESEADIVLILSGINPETGLTLKSATFDNINDLPINTEKLYPIMSHLRTIKTGEELKILRRAGLITSEALKYIMLRIRAGNYEYQADAIFRHFCYFSAGCKIPFSNGICSSGPNCANPKYCGSMERIICNGDLCILDMGATYCGYGAKVSITYPASGEFTWKQKNIYLAVEKVRENLLHFIKAGASCVDLQKYAYELLLENLRDLGILMGSTNEMMCCGLGAIFFPLSLIHFIGLDYNDVGGYITDVTPPPPDESWLSFIKTARILEENMVISFTTACYFTKEEMDKLLDNDDMASFVDKEKLGEYMEVGGIKLQDNLAILNEGYELLTHLPRTANAIEKWLKQPVELYINRVLNESLFSQWNFKFEDSEDS